MKEANERIAFKSFTNYGYQFLIKIKRGWFGEGGLPVKMVEMENDFLFNAFDFF